MLYSQRCILEGVESVSLYTFSIYDDGLLPTTVSKPGYKKLCFRVPGLQSSATDSFFCLLWISITPAINDVHLFPCACDYGHTDSTVEIGDLSLDSECAERNVNFEECRLALHAMTQLET